MLSRIRAMHIIAFANLLGIFYTFTDEIAQKTLLSSHVAQQYVNSIFKKPLATPIERSVELTGFYGAWEKFKNTKNPKTAILTPRETQEVAFDIVATVKNFNTSIIDSSFIDKLELVNGGENSSNHLFNTIFKDRINTTIGKAHAALTFCHPISDIPILKNRAQSIVHLSKKKELLGALNATLQQITPVEEQSLSFWHSKPIANQELIKSVYFGQTLKNLNTNTIALETMGKTIFLLQAGLNATIVPIGVAYITFMISRQINKSFKDTATELLSLVRQNTSSLQRIGIISGLSLFQAFLAYPFYCQSKSTKAIYSHIQNIMIATATHINALMEMSSIINKDKELLKYLPSLQPLADLNNATKHSAELNKLLGMLDTNTFKGEASFWSITGRVLAAYELMKQVKNELAPAFAAAGELDMYIALAKLYSSRESKEARYCMVNFIKDSTTPIIDAKSFWNPFIDPDTVVVNNTTFSATQPNSILTGPNTGGKSTIIKGVIINILMAQTFGITPSESFTLTPFSKLNCFMNISDDIATGASLFKSEVMRAKKLLTIVQGLQPNEFSFVIIDEVFTGTSPQEGEIAALQFAKKLGTYINNTSIIATHYPKMIDLEVETNGTYHNNHVEILRNEDGSLNRTFKFKDGPSFFNVAFDILKEEGLFV